MVSNLFCLPSAYRKDVLPPTGEISLAILFSSLSFIVSDGNPLLVYFKLPVSEISEIDDHKSVSRRQVVNNQIENFLT